MLKWQFFIKSGLKVNSFSVIVLFYGRNENGNKSCFYNRKKVLLLLNPSADLFPNILKENFYDISDFQEQNSCAGKRKGV